MKRIIKNKILRVILKIKFISISVLIILSQVMAGCLQFRSSNKKFDKYFAEKKCTVKMDTYQVDGRTIRYAEIGDETLPLVIFVHGAPGGLGDYQAFLADSSLYTKAHLIAVDRAGYGYSGFGKSVTSIEQQAKYIQPLLAKNKSAKKPILVGHSYGGPVVARMAMDFPEQIGSLILAAPALDPEQEKIFWINKPASWFVFRWLVPRAFRVANDEKMAHAEELALMMPYWKDIKIPVTYIHGEADDLVPYGNTDFAKKMLKNAALELVLEKYMGHLIPWKRPELIHDAVLKHVEK